MVRRRELNLVWISLERYSQRDGAAPFLDVVWRRHFNQTRVYAFLTCFEQFRLCHSCVELAVDRSDVALSATMRLLKLESIMSYWLVPTPPVEQIDEAPVENPHDEPDDVFMYNGAGLASLLDLT